MLEALLAGGILFWGIVVVFTLLLFVFIEYNQGAFATLSIIVVFCMLQWWARIDIIGAVRAEPLLAIAGVLGYLVAGTVWAVVKWWFYTKAERRKYDEFKAEWINGTCMTGMGKENVPYSTMVNPDGSWSDEMKRRFNEDLKSTYGDEKIDVRPQVAKHKQEIYLWLCYFPWSMIWTIINDPIRRAFHWIYGEIRQALQKISDNAWADTATDLPSNPNTAKRVRKDF